MIPINLKLIGELSLQALSNKHMVDSLCYNTDSKKTQIDDALFVQITKTYRQAENLYEKLRKIREVCTDFAAENFQSYIDEHNKWQDDDEPFDPLDYLERRLITQSVDDLPEKIEQYAELVSLAGIFVNIRRTQREGLALLFGKIPTYVTQADEDGQTIMVSVSDLPESAQREMEAKREINDVEVEYALDGYNEFYQIAAGMIGSSTGEDIPALAEAILSLYK